MIKLLDTAVPRHSVFRPDVRWVSSVGLSGKYYYSHEPQYLYVY